MKPDGTCHTLQLCASPCSRAAWAPPAFCVGLKQAAPEAEITVIGNTGDDITLFGLRVCPDLDTVMYTLGGGINTEQGWGRAGETFSIRAELAAYGASPDWFTLGDRDFATHILRSQLLAAGQPLSAVTEVLCRRWQPGVRLLPMSDDPVETHVVLQGPGERRVVHFQEWWVRMRAETPAAQIIAVRRRRRRPGPRRARRHRRGRRGPVPAVQPRGQHRHHPGRSRHQGGGRGQDRGGRVAHHRRLAGARDGRRLPGRDRGGHLGRGGRRALRPRADQRLARRRSGQGGRWTTRPWPGSRSAPSRSTCATCPPPRPSPARRWTWPRS